MFQLGWDSDNTVDCSLKGGGDEARLLIAGIEASGFIDSGEFGKMSKVFRDAGFKTKATYCYKGILKLLHLRNKQRYGTHLFGWKDESGANTPDYTCDIEISIYADPPLRRPFKHIYQLRLLGHGITFIEKPTSNKESS